MVSREILEPDEFFGMKHTLWGSLAKSVCQWPLSNSKIPLAYDMMKLMRFVSWASKEVAHPGVLRGPFFN